MKITETVIETREYREDSIPTNLITAIVWLTSRLEQIPQEYRASAKLELSVKHEYDMQYVSIRITYEREETDLEKYKREQVTAQKAALQEKRQRKTYLELKAKFEGK